MFGEGAGRGTRLGFARSLKIRLAARRLKRGFPLAKIIGEKWFYGLKFYTNRHTLDPRPDSETLVDAVLSAAGRGRSQMREQLILDLGTGTGCLVCAIVKSLPDASGVGIDKSLRAVRVARKNVRNLGLEDKIDIVRKDFGSKLSDFDSKFDVIVSNPPYIAHGDRRVNKGALYDPKMALYAGADGLDAYRSIARSACGALKRGGKIFLEIGAGQGGAVWEIFAGRGWRFTASHKDLGGIERVLEFALL
jgi:release factor glutamine methyltransferase